MININHCPASDFEAEFQLIFNNHMKGLPICHNGLQVRAIGFQNFKKHWIGAMVTPWSILVVLAQGNKSNWPEIQVGKILSITLPAGAFSLLGMASDRLGKFLACSLMSPVDPLFNQRSAEAFAARALMLMLTPESDSSHTTHSTRSAIPENLSRRDFFTTFSKEMIADDKP